MEYKINCQFKLNFKEYLKLAYIMTYRKISVRILLVIACLFLLFSLMLLIEGERMQDILYFPLLFFILMFVYIPFTIYVGARKIFRLHGHLQESVSYNFGSDRIEISGESYKSELSWDKVYKVLELNNWFLFYQNGSVANPVPKRSFAMQDIPHLRELITEQKNLKIKLKA